jgi:hypothetical protein
VIFNPLQKMTVEKFTDNTSVHSLLFAPIPGSLKRGRREMERCLLSEAEFFDPHDYETGSFYLQFVPIGIGCGDFDMALDHLNHWLAQRRTVGREDLQSLARILSLILHFELGNFLLLMDSQLRTFARFLKRKDRLHESGTSVYARYLLRR